MKSKKILFVGNHHKDYIQGICPLITRLTSEDSLDVSLLVIDNHDVNEVQKFQFNTKVEFKISSYEDFFSHKIDFKTELIRLSREYSSINWLSVLLAERSFNDLSYLFGASGERVESKEYKEIVLVNMVCFFEGFIKAYNPDAIIIPYADNMFCHIALELA